MDGAVALGPPDERQLFEAYNKSLNILPVEELPVHRVDWEGWRGGAGLTRVCSPAIRGWRRGILETLRKKGPLAGNAFVERGGDRIHWGWGPVSIPRAMLYALFRTGQIGIARRMGNVRVYDRMEALFPRALLARRLPDAEVRRHQLLSRFRGMGLLGLRASSEIWAVRVPAAERARITEGLVADRTLRRVQSRRGPRRAVHARQRYAVSAPGALRRVRRWHCWPRSIRSSGTGSCSASSSTSTTSGRSTTPEAKRKHGYYVLPILYGEALVGRIEPRIDRKADVLRVPPPRMERRMRRTERLEFERALDVALVAHQRLAGASHIERTARESTGGR